MLFQATAPPLRLGHPRARPGPSQEWPYLNNIGATTAVAYPVYTTVHGACLDVHVNEDILLACWMFQEAIPSNRWGLSNFIGIGELLIRSKNMVFSPAEWDELAEKLSLSPRQKQLSFHLLNGLGDKQIAAEIGIGYATVRTHMRRLFAKLQVRDRSELILRLFCVFRDTCTCSRGQRICRLA